MKRNASKSASDEIWIHLVRERYLEKEPYPHSFSRSVIPGLVGANILAINVSSSVMIDLQAFPSLRNHCNRGAVFHSIKGVPILSTV